MSNFLRLFISLFLIIIIPLVSTITYTCGPKTEDLKVGDYVIICFHILNEDQKLAMSVQVDEYSTISFKHINEIFNSLNASEGIEFLAQVGETITKLPTVSAHSFNNKYSYIIKI